MILSGRAISAGKSEGSALIIKNDFGFLGGVNAATGDILVGEGGNTKERVLVFPRGKGSTVGSFTMYDLKIKGNAPAAIINQEAETIVTTGAVISSIPMVDRVDISLLRNEDFIIVDGNKGTIELPDVIEKGVATSIVMKNGKVLMLQRSDNVNLFKGLWGGVSGTIEKGETPEQTAVREIKEETELLVSTPLSQGKSILIRNNDVIWKVQPLLFEINSGEPILNWENKKYSWMTESEIRKLDLVPEMISIFENMGVWKK